MGPVHNPTHPQEGGSPDSIVKKTAGNRCPTHSLFLVLISDSDFVFPPPPCYFLSVSLSITYFHFLVTLTLTMSPTLPNLIQPYRLARACPISPSVLYLIIDLPEHAQTTGTQYKFKLILIWISLQVEPLPSPHRFDYLSVI